MRAGMLAVAAALTAGLASGAWAQGAQTTQETARQAETPQTTAGAHLQAYALTLQDIEAKLRQAKQRAEGSPAQSQEGAMSQPRADLLNAIRAAWRDMQAVPPEISDSDMYKQAERRMQRDTGEARPTWQPSREETITAAEDALQTLAGLRQQVAQMAGQAGASIPAPPAAAGGSNR